MSHTHPHAHASPGPTLAEILDRVEVPNASRVGVDVGCGNGSDARWLDSAGFTAIGIDVSDAALLEAARRTPADSSISWLNASATNLPLEGASCALITDRGCLHHLDSDEQAAYAAEVGRTLCDDGVWIIRDCVGHHGQVAEIDRDLLERLAVVADAKLEEFSLVGSDGSHPWITAVMRRRKRSR